MSEARPIKLKYEAYITEQANTKSKLGLLRMRKKQNYNKIT